jgi:enoyl-[acyl-carrier protein] reductase II
MKVLANRVVKEWAGRGERTPTLPEPTPSIGRTLLAGQEYTMPKFSAVLPTPDTTGDFVEMCLAAGESAGLVRDIKPAGDIVRAMMSEAEQIIRERLASLL